MIERTRSMKNFFRAVKLGTRHRFTLLGAIFCSLMVALFWGANIGTVYPVVEVVFQGKAMPEWIDDEISRLEHEILQRQLWIDGQLQRPAETPVSSPRALELAQFRQRADKQALVWKNTVRP